MATDITSQHRERAAVWSYVSIVAGVALAFLAAWTLDGTHSRGPEPVGVQQSRAVPASGEAAEPVLVVYLVASEAQRQQVEYGEFFAWINGFSPANQQVIVLLAEPWADAGGPAAELRAQGHTVKLVDLRGR